MRSVIDVAALTLALTVGEAAGSPSSSIQRRPGRLVPCSESIDQTKWPYLGAYQRQHRYRQVLGVLSVPPVYMEQVVATHERPWAYWHKQGLVVRATGESVTITVPETWRTRVAILWGYGGLGPFSSPRIAGWGSNPKRGNAYSGGFYLASSSACVPLIFRVGTRTATVRFGVGRRCP